MTIAPLGWRLLVEFVGTTLLAAVVVIAIAAAHELSPDDPGRQRLIFSATTGTAVAILILLFQPVSGANLNPVVSLADWMLNSRTSLTIGELGLYLAAQFWGAVAGAAIATSVVDPPAFPSPDVNRTTPGQVLGELAATTGLVMVLFAASCVLGRILNACAVGVYLGTSMYVTGSTSLANPAVTITRSHTTPDGIALETALMLLVLQMAGCLVAIHILTARRSKDRHLVSPVARPGRRHNPSPQGSKTVLPLTNPNASVVFSDRSGHVDGQPA